MTEYDYDSYEHNKEIYIVDLSDVTGYYDFHARLRDSLEFPDYYGGNWSAFWDCLSDMIGEPLYIRIIGFENIEKNYDGYAEKMIEILLRAKHFDKDRYIDQIKIEIVRGDAVKELQ